MFETVQQLLRSRLDDDGVAVMHGDRSWTWREHLAEASAEASAIIERADPSQPMHIGALLGNTPAMLRAMAEGRYRLTPGLLAGNNAWLRAAVHSVTPQDVIAEALARPAPENPDGKAFVPPGGFAPPRLQ